MKSSSTRSLALLSGGFTFLSALFLLLWLVNLELALVQGNVELLRVAAGLPEGLRAFCLSCAQDLSTVSTLVPLLICLFPAWQAFRVSRALNRGEDPPLISRPYPPHFPFFLIMLGLAGTLYGLLIGLQNSGVETAADEMSADAVRTAVDRLLSGTATAVLSSLVGMIGAFVAARPVTWLFCSLLPPQAADEVSDSLEDTVLRLTEGLGRMDRTVRTITQSLAPVPLETLATRLEALEVQNQRVADHLERLTSATESAHQALSALPDVAKAQQSVSDQLQELLPVRETTNTHLETLISLHKDRRAVEEQTAARLAQILEAVTDPKARQDLQELLERLGRDQREDASHSLATLQQLEQVMREGDKARKQDREATRNAMAALLAGPGAHD